jgi:hypothetical protein
MLYGLCGSLYPELRSPQIFVSAGIFDEARRAIEYPTFCCHNLYNNMTVPEMMVLQAWEKAGGQCECRRFSHGHPYVRCTNRLVYEMRGSHERGGWAPRFQRSPTTGTTLSCEILCMDCFEQARADEMKSQT